jgi:multisubunit Na+/H+ antiporter MnhB subunit
MFGLGFAETGIVLVLGYLAFRHLIARRWPGVYQALNFVFLGTVLLVLLFGLLARLRH